MQDLDEIIQLGNDNLSIVVSYKVSSHQKASQDIRNRIKNFYMVAYYIIAESSSGSFKNRKWRS